MARLQIVTVVLTKRSGKSACGYAAIPHDVKTTSRAIRFRLRKGAPDLRATSSKQTMKPNKIKKPPPLPSGYAGRAFAVLVGLTGPALVALTVWLTLRPH